MFAKYTCSARQQICKLASKAVLTVNVTSALHMDAYLRVNKLILSTAKKKANEPKRNDTTMEQGNLQA